MQCFRSKATAARVALMKLKQTATGDRGIPDVDRIYFDLVLPSAVDKPTTSCAMFFSRTWSVGRVIDSVASARGLVNNNNIAGAKKLRLFDVNSGALFPSDRSLMSLLMGQTGQQADDKTLVQSETEEADLSLYNGSRVVLEYVDDAVHSLPGFSSS